MKEIELKVPNLGEAEDTEIIEISVKKGDKLVKMTLLLCLNQRKLLWKSHLTMMALSKTSWLKRG